MTENALITLESTILADNDIDTVSLTTVGSYYYKNKKHYIIYKESETTGFEGCTTTIKVWDGGISMTRKGGDIPDTNLIIEPGSINLCSYQTVAGSLMLDINGIELDNKLTDRGGSLSFGYSISASGMLISENKVNITVKEIN